MALTVWVPFARPAVFHDIAYGAAVSCAPALTPSITNCTPVTPTSSEAFAEMVVVPETVAPSAGDVTVTVGGVVSVGRVDVLETVTVTDDELRLPAASRAVARSVCGPFGVVVVSHETW